MKFIPLFIKSVFSPHALYEPTHLKPTLTVMSHRHDEAGAGGGGGRPGVPLRQQPPLDGGGHQAELLHRGGAVQRQLVRNLRAERQGRRHAGSIV